MKSILSLLMITLFAPLVGAQETSSSSEVMCRGQAKEAALQAYSGCMTTARNSQIEQIRADYKKELAEVKNKYDQELKKLSGGKATPKVKAAPVTVKEATQKSPKATKGIATKLPGRNSAGYAPPVQSRNDATAVVAAASETDRNSDSAIEREASQADQIDFIEMPTE